MYASKWAQPKQASSLGWREGGKEEAFLVKSLCTCRLVVKLLVQGATNQPLQFFLVVFYQDI
jgi:hypothetical protein